MGKDDGVYVFRPADGQCGTRHFDDGDGEVRQHAERQQDFQRQHRTEGSGKRFAQYRKIAVCRHHDAAGEQQSDHKRHHPDGAVRHCLFHFAPRLARHPSRMQDGQNQHFKKHAADKGNGAIQVDDVRDGINTHTMLQPENSDTDCITIVPDVRIPLPVPPRRFSRPLRDVVR